MTKEFQGSCGTSGRDHFKALFFEKPPDHLTLHRLVVDYQNMKPIGHLYLRAVERQTNLEAAPAACLVGNGNGPAVSFDNSSRDRQTEPSALRLGREVGLENSPLISWGYPGPRIRHGD